MKPITKIWKQRGPLNRSGCATHSTSRNAKYLVRKYSSDTVQNCVEKLLRPTPDGTGVVWKFPSAKIDAFSRKYNLFSVLQNFEHRYLSVEWTHRVFPHADGCPPTYSLIPYTDRFLDRNMWRTRIDLVSTADFPKVQFTNHPGHQVLVTGSWSPSPASPIMHYHSTLWCIILPNFYTVVSW